LVILNQTFFRLIHKAMNHISQIISCVANVANRSPLCVVENYRQIINECEGEGMTCLRTI